jgi:hypothetical protein
MIASASIYNEAVETYTKFGFCGRGIRINKFSIPGQGGDAGDFLTIAKGLIW